VGVHGGATGPSESRRAEFADALLWVIPDFVYVFNTREQQYVHSNGLLREFLGYEAFDQAGLTDAEFAALVSHPDEVQEHVDSIRDQLTLNPGDVITRQVRLRSRDGGYRWYSHTVRGFSFDSQGIVEVVGTLHDITSLVEAGARLEESEQRFRRLFDRNPTGVAVIDDLGVIVEANHALCELLGFEHDDLVGSNYDEYVHPDELGAVRQRRQQMLGSPDAVAETQRRFLHADGSIRHVRTLITRVVDAGRFLSIVSFDDVTAHLEAQRRLEHAAMHDPLTGLPNRRLLSQRLEQALARCRRGDHAVALLFLDLDRVKRVNDEFGHDAGDQILTVIAQRLLAVVRFEDTAARIGGDEFVIVCESISDADEVTALADRVLAAVNESVTCGERSVMLTASIGIATSFTGETGVDEMLRAADMAMYEAKTAGRARYVLAPGTVPLH
jgi:diguanylate cyclase (GGDEF)-like protein/PAS domain S-box-containing protein